jgi:hypothetical protein
MFLGLVRNVSHNFSLDNTLKNHQSMISPVFFSIRTFRPSSVKV